MRKKLTLVVAAAAAGVLLAGCSSDGYIDPSMKTLRYEAGATEGGEFVECIQAGKKIVTNDKLYPYPETQREAVWDSDHFNKGANSADYPDLVVEDKDGNEVRLKMKVQFFLNTDCSPVKVGDREYEGGVLQVLHEKIGKNRGMSFNEDGSYNNGWLWAMNNYVAAPAVKLAGNASREYIVEDIWLKPTVKDEMAGYIAERIQDVVDANMETDLSFYKSFAVDIFKAEPSQAYRAIYQERKNASEAAETAELNLGVKIKEAEANAKIAEQEAKVLQERIKGAGGPQWYWCGESLKKGLPCFQPNGPVMVGTK